MNKKKNAISYWDADEISSLKHSGFLANKTSTNLFDVSVMISCYNEQNYIGQTLKDLKDALSHFDFTYEIIVIDDGSKDKSVQIVKKFIEDNPDLNVLLRVNKFNKGLAQNYVDGAFIARGKYYRLLCGDNSEPVETLIKIFSYLGKADMILPYYTSAHGKSSARQIISKLYTSIINLISGNKFQYYNGLHIHLRENVMRWHPNTRGFGFQAGLLCMLTNIGCNYIEVPCVTVEQRKEPSNALTFKNLGSVVHIMLSIMIKRFSFQ